MKTDAQSEIDDLLEELGMTVADLIVEGRVAYSTPYSESNAQVWAGLRLKVLELRMTNTLRDLAQTIGSVSEAFVDFEKALEDVAR